jgi:hypothetical protein
MTYIGLFCAQILTMTLCCHVFLSQRDFAFYVDLLVNEQSRDTIHL